MTSHDLIDTDTLTKAARLGQRLLAVGPLATSARYLAGGRIQVNLSNACVFEFPVSMAQGLAGAKVANIRTIKIEAAGLCLYWPKLDVDLYIPNLLNGVFGTKEWMAKIDEQSSKLNPTQLKGMFGKAGKVVSIEEMNQSIAGRNLPAHMAETLLRLLEIHDMAADIFATKEAASAWLREPHPMLDNERPLDAAKTSAGAQAVKNLLTSTKYGGAA